MNLDTLKTEALKLEKSDLFDLAQFIIEALKEIEIAERIAEFKKDPSCAISGLEAEKNLIEKYDLKL